MRAKDALGRFGETLAAAHLREQGFVILDLNWRCAVGEVDIVAREGQVVVICEVKTRRGIEFGTPLEAITRAKAVRLRRLSVEWAQAHAPLSGPLRIDVIGILLAPRGLPEIEHLRGAL